MRARRAGVRRLPTIAQGSGGPDWPEAQKFRASLKKADGTPLGDKDLHVSLNGGIGDAVAKRNAPLTGDE